MIGRKVGSYEIVERLGEGGMGTVYRAVDRMLDREVALKVIRPELASEPEVAERFRAEARAIARVNHPAVATIYSFVEEGGELFLALELVRGRTLSQVLREEGALPWQRAVPLLAGALDGIEQAHRLGIVHRDLKPDNLMLTDGGGIKVMDFGIARVAGSTRLTRTGLVIGTLRYMAPEQIRGEEADRRTDVYALGIVLYEALAGRVPFSGASDYALLKAQLEEAPTPLSTLVSDLPAWLDRAVLRALAKEPSERFQSAEELRTVLLQSTRETPLPTIPGLSVVAPAASVAAGSTTPGGLTAPTRIQSVLPAVPTASRPIAAAGLPQGAAAGTAAAGTYRAFALGGGGRKGLLLAAAAAFLVLALAAGVLWKNLDSSPEPVQTAAIPTPSADGLPATTGPAQQPSPFGVAAPPPVAPPTATSSRPRPMPEAAPPRSDSTALPTPIPAPPPVERDTAPAPEPDRPASSAPPASGAPAEDTAVEPLEPARPGETEAVRLLGEIANGTVRLGEVYEVFLEQKEDGGAELTAADEQLREELEVLEDKAVRVRRLVSDGPMSRVRNRLRGGDEAARRADLQRRLGELRASAERIDGLMAEIAPSAEVRSVWQDLRRRGRRVGELLAH